MSDWPVADRRTYQGLAGEFVQQVEPHTEADPMALLAQFLVTFGVCCGRTAYWSIEASKHHTNEFCILVGSSSKGRKGSSWDHVESLFARVDPEFISTRLASGLTSGEGIIAQVEDPADELSKDRDGRLLTLEPEFAQVMKVLSREGNTLSPVVRNAWDGKVLQTMARNSPLRATGAHIGIIGHITKEELLRYLKATELANGFFNRFLVVAVQRSKVLPFGGDVDEAVLTRIADKVDASVRFARETQSVEFSSDARAYWIEVYPWLSKGESGMYGAATARAEAHVARLALLSALLDQRDEIDEPDLDVALGIWAYVSDSVRWIFGDSLGDPTADEIWSLAKERSGGVSLTEIRDLFSRNKKSHEIERALGALVDAGRLKPERLSTGPGRPARIWVPTG